MSRRLRLSAAGSLSPGQVSILGWLDINKSLTLGELANLEQVRPPSITPHVNSLQDQGLVTCATDQSDRRSKRVVLTSKGRKELNVIRRRRTEFLEQKLLKLSCEEREKAAELVAFLETLLEDS
ncbi:MAG: MarR family transcriptional regulator [Acidimicrobiaceae bacterium]|nr:MarR family transcriptional regulator [Acidimicrobiaceae bacterium]